MYKLSEVALRIVDKPRPNGRSTYGPCFRFVLSSTNGNELRNIKLNNGDTKREFKLGAAKIRGLGSFHKSLPHNKWGEVHEIASALAAAR